MLNKSDTYAIALAGLFLSKTFVYFDVSIV